MPLLTVDKRLARYKDAGYEILGHVTKQAADEGAKNGSNCLDQKAAQILDGFYQIVQYNDEAEMPLAAMPKNPGGNLTPASTLPVVMGSETGVIGRFFKLTRQFGVTNGFTIVPVRSDIPAGDPVKGATTTNNSDKLNIKRSAEYPLWVLRCDESATIRTPDGGTITVDYFRVLEVGSQKCWKTGSEAKEPPISLSTVSSAPRPPHNELYEIIRSDVEQTVKISSVDNIIAKATSANVIRKFYFSNGVLPAGKADTIISLQLSTDARNQGWASNPGLGLFSWFELAILTKNLKPGDLVTDQIKKVDGKLLTFVSHYIPLDKNYTEQAGPVFTKDHELLKHIGATDVIAVLGCAQYPQWVCDVRRGDLKIRELVLNP